MYERAGQPVISRRAFIRRVLGHGGLAALTLLVSLLVGMAGYAGLEGLSLLDSFLNAAMILGGMGPVSPLSAPAAKVFAGLYALYSGLVLIAAAGIVLSPIVHRLIHHTTSRA
jgi:hypothetical protein